MDQAPDSPPVPTENPIETPANNPEWLPRWEIVLLGLGDMVVYFIFVIMGRDTHGISGSEGPVLATINSAMPFVVGWLIVGAVLGAFSGKALFPLKRVIGRTLLAAVVAGPVGVLLRAALQGRMPAPIFFGVATGVSTLLMLVWRVLWSRIRRLWWPELP